MRQEIQFIKWKNLSTKSIDDLVVSAFFEINTAMYEIIHKHINKVLLLEIELKWNKIELNCNINTDTKWYISYSDDHWVLRLDIVLPDELLVWYILKWNIFLTLK